MVRAAGRRQATRRQRAQPVTRAAIAAAGIVVADRDGLEALTMRSLGTELGVDPMVVYRHFASKDEVLDAMLDTVVGEIRPPDTDSDQDLLGRIRGTAHRLRATLLAHPGVAGIVARRPPLGPNTFRAIETAMSGLRAAGLDPTDAAYILQTITTYTLGFVSLEVAGRTETDPDAAIERMRLAYESLPASQFPNTVTMADHIVARNPDAHFDFGLDLLLAGVAQRHLATGGSRPRTARRRRS